MCGAVVTMLGIGMLWLGTRTRDRDFEMQMSSLNSEAGAARERAGKLEERAALLAIELEGARAETARSDANLLAEQRLTARERMRLTRLESIILPRSIDPAKDPAKADELIHELKIGNFSTVNIAVADRTEPKLYGISLMKVLQETGIFGKFLLLSKNIELSGVTLYGPHELERDHLGSMLWQKFQIGGGSTNHLNSEEAAVPADDLCLIIRDNNAAFQEQPGQPGEGLDEHGRPVTAPR